MVNFSGIGGAISAIVKPRSLVPQLTVPDISHLNWQAFKSRGVIGVVIDKDNCITKPGEDTLVPTLQPAWNELLKTFGSRNVLICSNSAGTNKDSLLLQAESVSRNLQVPILVHSTFKPGLQCARQVSDYFLPPIPTTTSPRFSFFRPASPRPSSIKWTNSQLSTSLFPSPASSSSAPGSTPKILIIGDRITTDILLSHRISSLSSPPSTSNIKLETIGILTTILHAKEGLGTTLLRSLEKLILYLLSKSRSQTRTTSNNWSTVLHSLPPPLPIAKQSSTMTKHLAMFINSYDYTQGSWNFTNQVRGVFKRGNGVEYWTERGVEGVERGWGKVERRVKEGRERVGI